MDAMASIEMMAVTVESPVPGSVCLLDLSDLPGLSVLLGLSSLGFAGSCGLTGSLSIDSVLVWVSKASFSKVAV